MESKIITNRRRALFVLIFWGMAAGAGMIGFYFLILMLSNSLEHAIEEFSYLWPWILGLSTGFAAQAGLFAHIVLTMRRKKAATASVAVSGGMSATSMVACCAHHLTDVLPLLGVSAAAIFLTRFQNSFMLLGIFSNLVGVFIMLSVIQKNSLYDLDNRMLSKAMKINMKISAMTTGLIGVLVTGTSIYLAL